jgi:hypothetical protein
VALREAAAVKEHQEEMAYFSEEQASPSDDAWSGDVNSLLEQSGSLYLMVVGSVAL